MAKLDRGLPYKELRPCTFPPSLDLELDRSSFIPDSQVVRWLLFRFLFLIFFLRFFFVYFVG